MLEVRRRVQLDAMLLVDTGLLRGQRHISAVPVDAATTSEVVVAQLVAQFHTLADGIALQVVTGGVPGRILRPNEQPLGVLRTSSAQHACMFRLARTTTTGLLCVAPRFKLNFFKNSK